MSSYWSRDSLWAKTQVYVQRAAEEERDGPLFAFWSHLALELLARTALASVSPVLLADRRGGSPKSVLYALGRGEGAEAKSAATADLFALCVDVVDGFTTEHRDAALLMLNRRNRELHTGEPAFEDLPLHAWQANYYRLCGVLLEFQGLTLKDLFGEEESAAAQQMIAAVQERIEKSVRDMIAGAARAWKNLPDEERQARERAAVAQPRPAMAKTGRCPACETGVSIEGEQVAVGQARLDRGNELVEEVRMLPTRLRCRACGLNLTGHAEMHVAGLGGQFTILRVVDPVEFHSIDIDEYVDPDRYIAIPDGPEYEDE